MERRHSLPQLGSLATDVSSPPLPRSSASPSAAGIHRTAMSKSVPSLLLSGSLHRSSHLQKVLAKTRADGKSKSSGKFKPARLPLSPDSPALLDMYRLVEELATLWDDTNASEKQRIADTEAFAAVAVNDLQKHVANWKQRKVSLEDRCRALSKKVLGDLVILAGEVDQVLWDRLSAELKEAGERPLDARLAALQTAAAAVSHQVCYVAELREAVAEGMRALGLDPSKILQGGVAALEEEMERLKAGLYARRCAALQLLGEASVAILAKDDVEYLRLLTAEVKRLEARVRALQAGTVQAACRACFIWEALGESTESDRDSHALRLSSNREPEALQEAESAINSVIAASVEISLSAWEARHEFATAEQKRLHRALRAFGMARVVEPFLKEHGSVHFTDREACQRELEQYLIDARASEASALQYLRRLCEEAGLGSVTFEAFAVSLDGASSKKAREDMLAKEITRLESYIASIAAILGPLRELKALVVAAVAFEANVQAGKTRFSGNSLHFLEEEKFRRRFAHCYPELRQGLIEAIAQWEAKEKQTFIYHSLRLREGLLGIQGLAAGLVRVPGDLSALGAVVTLLNIADPGVEVLPPRKQRRGNSSRLPSPASSTRSRSSSASPSKRKGPKRVQSVEHLPRPKASGLLTPTASLPVLGVAGKDPARRARKVVQAATPEIRVSSTAHVLESPSLSPPKPPRCPPRQRPEGAAGGGDPKSMAALHIASSLRMQ